MKTAKKQLLPKGPKTNGKKQLSPLEYMISVINDPKASENRRDKFAFEAARYMHERKIQRVMHEGTSAKEHKPIRSKKEKPLGKKDQLLASAKNAHKKNDWGSDLQQ